MTCRELDKISEYVDNELGGEHCRALEAHIASCDDCKSVLSAMREERRILKSGFASMRAPGDLRKRIINALNEEVQERPDSSRQTSFIRRLLAPNPAWALVSLILLLAAGMTHLKTIGVISPAGEKPTTMGLYIKDITHDSYLTYGLPQRPLDVKEDDAGKVGAFLSGYVGFDVKLPDLGEAGYTLAGGRLWHTVSRISALAVYEDSAGSALSLFAIKKERIGKRGARTIVADGRTFYFSEGYGYHGVAWIEGDLAFGLVGDVPFEALLKAARAAANDLAR